MKRISFVLLGLALATAACTSTADPDDTSAADSKINAGDAECPALSPPAPNFCVGGTIVPRKSANGCLAGFDCVNPTQTQCAARGGECVGLSPTSCQGGVFADATNYSCGGGGGGGGVGVGCCIQCPQLSPPAPGFCTGGTIVPITSDTGCTTGFDCIPPTQTQCEAKGGACVGLSPSSCQSGVFAPATSHSCGGGIGVGCCVECPQLSPPAPGFCSGGTIVPIKNDAGCSVGFDCVH